MRRQLCSKWREQIKMVSRAGSHLRQERSWEAAYCAAPCPAVERLLGTRTGGLGTGQRFVTADHCLSWRGWCHPDRQYSLACSKMKPRKNLGLGAWERREEQSDSYGKSEGGFFPGLLPPFVFPTPKRAFIWKMKLKTNVRDRLTLRFPSPADNQFRLSPVFFLVLRCIFPSPLQIPSQISRRYSSCLLASDVELSALKECFSLGTGLDLSCNLYMGAVRHCTGYQRSEDLQMFRIFWIYHINLYCFEVAHVA